jgi:hypothetical protein
MAGRERRGGRRSALEEEADRKEKRIVLYIISGIGG